MKNTLIARMIISAGILNLALTQAAHATATVELVVGSDTTTIADGSAADTNSAANQIAFTTTLDGYTVTGGFASAQGTNQAPTVAEGDGISITNSGTSTQPLMLLFSDTGYGPTGGIPTAKINILSDSGETVSFQTYADSSNTLFGTDTTTTAALLTSMGPITAATPGQISSTGSYFSLPAKYSLTEILTISGVGNVGPEDGLLSINLAPPPPASVPDGGSTVALLGLTFAGLAILHQKRKRLATSF